MANVTKTVSFKVDPALVHRAIPGEHREDREPGNPKYDRIMAKSKRRGFKPKTITIDVNGQGQAHIADGNTHAAVGAALGVKKMKAQIRYHDGSENLLSAKKLKKKLAVRHMAEGGSVDGGDDGDDTTTVDPLVVVGPKRGFWQRQLDTLQAAVGDPGAFAKGVAAIPGDVGSYLSSHTPGQMAGDVGRFGASVVQGAIEHPIQTLASAIPGVGSVMSASDAAHMRQAAAQARAQGDPGTAQKYEQMAAVAGTGVLAGLLPFGGEAAKALEGGVAREAAQGAELAAKYGLPEFMANLTPAQIEANRASFLEGNHPDVPDVVYHGTSEDIPSFVLGHPTQNDKGWLGKGIYTAPDALLAALYASKKAGSAAPNIMPLHPSLKNPYMATASDREALRYADDDTLREFTDQLKNAGHDGVVFTHPNGSKEFAVFSPAQLKSTMNRGTFDPNDPHLNKARGGLVEKYGLAT